MKEKDLPMIGVINSSNAFKLCWEACACASCTFSVKFADFVILMLLFALSIKEFPCDSKRSVE